MYVGPKEKLTSAWIKQNDTFHMLMLTQ